MPDRARSPVPGRHTRRHWPAPRPARDRLTEWAGEWLLGAWLAYRDDRAAVSEDDEFGITVQLTPEQANRLADLLRRHCEGSPVHAPPDVRVGRR